MDIWQRVVQANYNTSANTMFPKRFIVVGGNPFNHSYTGLRLVGVADTKEQVETLWYAAYDECGGLMIIIDTHNPFQTVEVSER